MLSLNFDIERIIHSFKTALACAIGVIIGKTISPYGGQWIVITILIVMCAQIYVGSVIGKSFLRLLGTFAGCFVAAFTIITFGPSTIAILITLAISSFLFSYIATLNENLTYAGTLGAATTAIILMYPVSNLDIATARCVEISTGIVIATIISQFILPINARTHLRRVQAKTLSLIRDYFLLITKTPCDIEETPEDLDETIAKSLMKQRQLAKESMREPFGVRFNFKTFMETLHTEKEILRTINLMYQALCHVPNKEQIMQSPLFKTFTENVVDTLNVLITAIENPKHKTPVKLQIPDIIPLESEIYQQLRDASQMDMISTNGLLFSAEMLLKCVRHLAEIFVIAIEGPEEPAPQPS